MEEMGTMLIGMAVGLSVGVFILVVELFFREQDTKKHVAHEHEVLRKAIDEIHAHLKMPPLRREPKPESAPKTVIELAQTAQPENSLT